MPSVTGVRSLRTRLVALVIGITFLAIAVISVYVVPQLSSRLRDEKLDGLAGLAADYSAAIERTLAVRGDVGALDRAVRQAGDRANARVTLFGISTGTQGLQVYPISDSADDANLGGMRFGVALDAARARTVQTAVEEHADGDIAQAARPVAAGGSRASHVIVFSQPLGDVAANVDAIRRQILIAGALALLAATLAGSLLARRVAVRVRRLEAAAQRIAAGDFSEPIPVDSDDELGQLARAFNDMQSQLGELDSARKRFIATASHELRTPLTSLGGFVELLADEELDEETRARFLEQLRLQVDRLRDLTLALLDLSKLEAGALELDLARVDVGRLARDVATEFEALLARHDSHLEVRLGARPIRAHCDAGRVAQILRILIDNALTHTPPGTDVVVTAVRDDGRVKVAVRDNGEGLAPDAMSHLFEPFATTAHARGSGLGLAIARELAERMDGRLTADSRPGATVFELELPA